MQTLILPFLILFPKACGGIGYIIGNKKEEIRDYFLWIVTAMVLASTLLLRGEYKFLAEGFSALSISLQWGGLHSVLAVMTAFVWLVIMVVSKTYLKEHQNKNRYYFFIMMTLGAVMGVFLSADLYTTFLFFEIMSFTSYILIIHTNTKENFYAAYTYLAFAVIGGLVTLTGIFLLYNITGTLVFSELKEALVTLENKNMAYATGILILFGFAAKAGMFLVHTWLIEAYTQAPTTVTAILSCILSKTGIYGILILGGILFLHDETWGMTLVYFGIFTLLCGGILAIYSIDLKKILACSSMSQIGFILVGIGMQGVLGEHNVLAVEGSILHMVNHTIVKLILFLTAGILFMNIKSLNLNDIKGYGRGKPFLMSVFLMGALGVMGIPLWNGYISKTLIHESIVEKILLLEQAGKSTVEMQTIEYLFLIGGGFTVAYMTKIFVAVFVEKPKQKQYCKKYINGILKAVLGFCAILPSLFGIFPHLIQDNIAKLSRGFVYGQPPEHTIEYFSWINLKGAVISLAIGSIIYIVWIRMILMKKTKEGSVYIDKWPNQWNIQKQIYEPIVLQLLPFLGALTARVIGSVTEGFIVFCQITIFNNKTGKVIPKEDAYFSVYTQAGKRIFKDNLSKSLAFFGAGFAFAMLYILG